ncbi:MAG TPA: hypothetical protein VIC05_00325 [Solirubrobacteraceae bacterium]|jgi:hypothetical protein
MRRSRSRWFAPLLAVAVLVSGCGSAREDAHEPNETFSVQVLRASFPQSQAVSHSTKLELEVRNTSSHTIPNLAVTIGSFIYRSDYPGLADPRRPVWIVDQGPGAIPKIPVRTVPFDSPGNDVTANASTWSTGAVRSGQTRTFVWDVTPVRSGSRTVTYTFAAGLNGKARAELQSGSPASGSFTVNVSPAPRVSHVSPRTGALVPGPLLVAP